MSERYRDVVWTIGVVVFAISFPMAVILPDYLPAPPASESEVLRIRNSLYVHQKALIEMHKRIERLERDRDEQGRTGMQGREGGIRLPGGGR